MTYSKAFELRIRLYRTPGPTQSPVCTITAYDDNTRLQDSHNRVDIEVKHDGAVVFPRGQLWVGIPKAGGHATDGIYAKAAVLSCVAMRPSQRGGEGRAYYDGYTPEQLAWVEAHGDALDAEREHRYCDENGNVRARSRS